jgi:hypothetical protein
MDRVLDQLHESPPFAEDHLGGGLALVRAARAPECQRLAEQENLGKWRPKLV